MTERTRAARSIAWMTIVVAMLVVALGAISISIADAGPSAGVTASRLDDHLARNTPVSATAQPTDPLDGDPLDGDPRGADPLDSDLPGKDTGSPTDNMQFDIPRSGRPDVLPRSDVAYDGNPDTIWTPEQDGEDAWLWLDLGVDRRVREVRWLARGAGAINVSISSDRRHWQDVDQIDVAAEWQGVTLRDDARYIRLTLQPDDEGNLPGIAEASVYGRGDSSVSMEQKAKKTKKSEKDSSTKKNRGSGNEKSTASGGNTSDNGNGKRRGGGNSNNQAGISTKPGETRCDGDRERCTAREGRVSVEDDCTQGGSCTIDIQADGGTAICDAAGGDQSKAGSGSGKQGGDGGKCEAVANGGAVAIGDINP